MIIQVLARTKMDNQTMGVAGLSEHLKKMFRMVEITKVTAIHPSGDDALKVLS